MRKRATGGAAMRCLVLIAASCLVPLAGAGGVTSGAELGAGRIAEGEPARTSPADGNDDEAADGKEPVGRSGWDFDVFPVLFSSPETGFGGGAGCAFTHRGNRGSDSAPPHSVLVIFYYTEKKQYDIWVAPDLYLRHGRWHVRASIDYLRMPSHFYQVGSYHAKDYLVDDDAEEYTIETVSLQPWLLRSLYSHLRAGIVYDLRRARVLKVEQGGILERELVHGHDGGVLSGLGPALEWDSRNHVFYPSCGGWYQLYCLFYHHRLGADFDFQGYWIDLRHFVTVRSPHILAFQAWVSKRAGHIPFTRYAAIGGQMRGIHAERLQDRYAAVAQAEYRYPIWRRFSGVAFVSLGEVAHRAGGFTLGDVKYTGGAGVRFALNPADKLNVRFDVGIGEWGAETYFQIQEAF